jgi:hypothetical protein
VSCDHSESVTTDAFSQLEVLGHDCHSLGVDSAEIGVLEERNEIGLGCFLESQDSLTLESDFLFELSGDLTDQSLEGQLSDKQISLNKSSGEIKRPNCKS